MTLALVDEKSEKLRERVQLISPAFQQELDDRLDASWVYHDAALEGIVLTAADIQAAMTESDTTVEGLSLAVPESRLLCSAIRTARELAQKRKHPSRLEVIRRFYQLVTPDVGGKVAPYRRDNPLHRLYFHEIAAPERIATMMKRLGTWLDGAEAKRMHPVLRASRAHFELMRIFPWTHNSGRVSRLLMNYMLLSDRYPPAVIHATDRQRYYESLRIPTSAPGEDEDDSSQLAAVVVEALDNGLDSALRFVEDATRDARKLRAAS